MMKRKAVYLNGELIGFASTWYEVAAVVGKNLGRDIGIRKIFSCGSEGPDGFYIEMHWRRC